MFNFDNLVLICLIDVLRLKKNSYLSHNSFYHVANSIITPIASCENSPHTVTAKGDSAATGHFFTVQDSRILKDIQKESGLNVTLPDNAVIGSTHSAHLQTPTPLPSTATILFFHTWLAHS